MLSKTHLTSHSRMSGSEWQATSSWLSRSLRSLLYSSVYSFHLFLISSALIRTLPLLSYIVPIFGWNVPLIFPIFLKRSLALPFLLFSSISLYCPLMKAFWSLLAILWNSAFSSRKSSRFQGTGQLQLLWHQWLGHRLRLLRCWMDCLGNEPRSLLFLRLHPRTAFWTLVDYEGYSISSKQFLPTVVDIMVI